MLRAFAWTLVASLIAGTSRPATGPLRPAALLENASRYLHRTVEVESFCATRSSPRPTAGRPT